MRTLSNRLRLPDIGFGTYMIPDSPEGEAIIEEALKIGYRLIDSASYYGNERAMGEAVRNCGIKRDEILVTGKVWKDQLGYASALRAYKEALKVSGLERLDIYLIHWPSRTGDEAEDRRRNLDTWRAITSLYKDGSVRVVGVSNFTAEELAPLMETEVPPMINQVEFNPLLTDRKTYDYCRKSGIQLEAYQPLLRGKVLKNPTVDCFARENSITPAQASVGWIIEKGVIPIPKSISEKRMKENLDTLQIIKRVRGWVVLDALSFNKEQNK